MQHIANRRLSDSYKWVTAGVCAVVLMASAVSTGCQGSLSAGQLDRDADTTTVVVRNAAPALASTHTDSCNAPLRVVVLQDKTGSTAVNRTPQIQMSDLEPVIERVTRCGGELALGIIDTMSNSSLARLYVPEPKAAPEPPERRGTPFQVVEARDRYESRRAQYELTAQQHQADAQRCADVFRAEAAGLLGMPPDASRTDIWGAISRGAYFLAEPGTWQRTPRLIAAVVSDAVDNVRRQSVPLPEGAELYLINGAPSLGALTALNPVRFESFGAAVRYVLNSN